LIKHGGVIGGAATGSVLGFLAGGTGSERHVWRPPPLLLASPTKVG
jgi:hypothetical protein